MTQTRGERVTQVWDDPKLWIHEEDIGSIVKARFYEARSSGKWLYGFEISYTCNSQPVLTVEEQTPELPALPSYKYRPET